MLGAKVSAWRPTSFESGAGGDNALADESDWMSFDQFTAAYIMQRF
jgi:hypothetical protein